eukprot:808653-Prorocentrum_minimum.AAC.1
MSSACDPAGVLLESQSDRTTSSPHREHVIAMSSPRREHVIATSSPRREHVIVNTSSSTHHRQHVIVNTASTRHRHVVNTASTRNIATSASPRHRQHVIAMSSPCREYVSNVRVVGSFVHAVISTTTSESASICKLSTRRTVGRYNPLTQ